MSKKQKTFFIILLFVVIAGLIWYMTNEAPMETSVAEEDVSSPQELEIISGSRCSEQSGTVINGLYETSDGEMVNLQVEPERYDGDGEIIARVDEPRCPCVCVLPNQ